MSYTPKTWQDYPPNTNTPITASELNRIERGIADSYTAIDTAIGSYSKNYVVDSFLSVNPGWTRSTLQKTVTLGTTDITCSVAKSDFDPDSDGVMIWQGNFLFLTDYYTFDTTTDPDNVIISFAENTRTRFELSTSIEIVIYEKPPDSGGSSRLSGRLAAVLPRFTTANIEGGSVTNITPTLYSKNTAEDFVHSVTTGRLLSNEGGLLVVIVMHRAEITISGTGWSSYKKGIDFGGIHSGDTNYMAYCFQNPYSYDEHTVTVFYKPIAANTAVDPITVSYVTENYTQRLNVNAMIIDGCDGLTNLTDYGEYPYPPLTWETEKSEVGVNLWAFSSNAVWGDDLCIVGDSDTTPMSRPSVDNATGHFQTFYSSSHRLYAALDDRDKVLTYTTFFIGNAHSGTPDEPIILMHFAATTSEEE